MGFLGMFPPHLQEPEEYLLRGLKLFARKMK